MSRSARTSIDEVAQALHLSYSNAANVVAGLIELQKQHLDPTSIGVDELARTLGIPRDEAGDLLHYLQTLNGQTYSTTVDVNYVYPGGAPANIGTPATPGISNHTGYVPSFHTGLLPGEYMAKLLKNEAVMNPDATRTFAPLLGLMNKSPRAAWAMLGGGQQGRAGAGQKVTALGIAGTSIVVHNHGSVITEKEFEEFLRKIIYRFGIRNGTTGIR